MVILKTLVGSLAANVNEITFTDTIINSNSIIEVYYNSNDIYTVETWQRENTIGIVTSDHDFPVSVKVLINNVVAFEPYDDTSLVNRIDGLEDRIGDAEDAISGLATRVGNAEDDIDALETGKQDVLTAGDNITIENNVISASGGGGLFDLDVIHNEQFTASLVANTNNLVKEYTLPDVGIYLITFTDIYNRNNNRSYCTISFLNDDALTINGYNDNDYLDTLYDAIGYSTFTRTVIAKTLSANAKFSIYLWGNGYNPTRLNLKVTKIISGS